MNFAANEQIIQLTYLAASVLFILALKWMSSPATAERGVRAGEIGMVLAIGGTLLNHGIVDYKWIAIAVVLGTVIGIPLGLVRMTAVPQRTALSHAFGALCVTLVGIADFYLRTPKVSRFTMAVLSLAAGKLQEILPQRPLTYTGQNVVNLSLLAVAIVLAAYLVVHPSAT
jgi:NAD(P) transhydrogenase subunit beta